MKLSKKEGKDDKKEEVDGINLCLRLVDFESWSAWKEEDIVKYQITGRHTTWIMKSFDNLFRHQLHCDEILNLI